MVHFNQKGDSLSPGWKSFNNTVGKLPNIHLKKWLALETSQCNAQTALRQTEGILYSVESDLVVLHGPT